MAHNKSRKYLAFVVLALFICCPAAFAAAGGTGSPARDLGAILAEAESGQYRAGELLVKFKSGSSCAQPRRVHQATNATVLKRLAAVEVEHVQLPPGLGVKDAIRQYMQDPDVEYAEPNYLFAISPIPVIPDDPFFGLQWGPSRISATTAWAITRGSPDVVMVVMDTGIDFNHPDLSENVDLILARNFSDSDTLDDINGHGTHVSGIIGAVGNNGLGVAGLMWQARLLNVKTGSDDGFVDMAGVAAAVDYVVTLQKEQGVNVRAINMSFTGPSFSNVVYDAIAAAERAGMLAIAAAGNESGSKRRYPAGFNLPNIISVAGTDQNDLKADFSNYGRRWVHIAAPGDDIWSTGPTHPNAFGIESYGSLSGTSMSTAFVTGLAGLLAAQYPHFTYKQIKGTILRYGDALPSLRGLVATGRRINAFKAVSSLLAPTDLALGQVSPKGVTLAWTDNATGENGYLVERRTGSGPFVRIATLGRDRTLFTDVAKPGATYTYRVRAYNTIPAKSLYSNEVMVSR